MPKSAAPFRWHPLPAMHHRHGKNRWLLDQFGVAGPYGFLVLLSEAASITWGRGRVQMAWADWCAYIATEDKVCARSILAAYESFGWVKFEREDEWEFHLAFPNWAEWDKLPRSDAERKADQRARESA